MRMDAMVEMVRKEIATCKDVSASWVQRKLGLSYGQASDSLRALELRGLVGPQDPANGYRRTVYCVPNELDRERDYECGRANDPAQWTPGSTNQAGLTMPEADSTTRHAPGGTVGAIVRRRCQNCGNSEIIRHRGERRGMPLIICGIDTRIGWDRTREWGETCDKWVPSNVTGGGDK